MMLVILPVVAAVVLLDKKKPAYDESFPASRRMLIVCISALVIVIYDGFYGPGTGTFLLPGHYIGSGLVMKNGSTVVRPVIILVLLLLFIKIISGN